MFGHIKNHQEFEELIKGQWEYRKIIMRMVTTIQI